MNPQLFHIRKAFGNLLLFDDFTMGIEPGHITCILGPSGCGKTTLLNILLGIVKPDDGTVTGIDHKAVAAIFQEHRLLPWKTVWENMDFVLKSKMSSGDRRTSIQAQLDMVGLNGFESYYPSRLSGGMKQRAAIARAFCYPASLILMDEPFKGLDLKLKESIMESFRSVWEKDRRTVLFVTHDLDEAINLGEVIQVFSNPPVRILRTFYVDPSSKNSLKQELTQLVTGE